MITVQIFCRVPRVVLLVLALLATYPMPGIAQEVRAYLSENEVALNRRFVLNVEVQGTQQIQGDPELPDLSAFAAYLGSGTSTSMQFVNGRTTTSLTIQFQYQATTEGTFEIGAVTVPVEGRNLRTERLQIRIAGAPTASGRSRSRSGDGAVAAEDLFVTATPSKTRVYVNEPVIVEYRIFTRVDVEGFDVTQQPSTAGFWVEELPLERGPVEQVVRDGVQYASRVIRRVAVFPTSAGSKTLEPMLLEVQVRRQRRSRGFGDPFGNPFGGLLGGGLFGGRVALGVGSSPVDIEVMPLPEGEPPSFTGLVGELTVAASLDRDGSVGIETNDALTFRVEMSATGNIRTLAAPVVDFPQDLEVYPPDVSERVEPTVDGVRSRKVFEYVLVPRAPGETVIPAIELAYLDATQGTYEVAASAPISLTVSGDAVAASTVSIGRLRTGIDLQRQDIRFIRVAIPSFHPIDRSLVGSVSFWSVLVLPLFAVAGAAAIRRHQDRLRGDVAYARRRRASRVAKGRIARAEMLRTQRSHREFHAEVARAMYGFLGDKLNVAEAGLIHDSVRGLLSDRQVPSDVIDLYLSCLEDCDRQRFAPVEPDDTAMQEMLDRAGQAMTDLDQAMT